MAFSSTVTARSVFGNKHFVWGTFTNTAGSTGGDIATSLSNVDFVNLQVTGSAAGVTAIAVVNETLPLSSGAVTIVTGADEDGVWFAYGTQ